MEYKMAELVKIKVITIDNYITLEALLSYVAVFRFEQ